MRIYKRLTALLLCLLCMAVMTPLTAAAAEFDPTKPLSLTVTYKDGKTPVTGATFRLYKIASMDTKRKLTVDPTFSKYKSTIENPKTRWNTLANTLKKYVDDKDIKEDDSAKTESDGKAYFPSDYDKLLTPGVYLLLSDRYRCNDTIYEPTPVIITLPNYDVRGNWTYDVQATAKFTPEDGEPFDLIVEKKWIDNGHEKKRPSSIIVVLLRNGEPYGSKLVLNEKNNWTDGWYDLDPMYDWDVKEVKVTGYVSTVKPPEKDGSTWTIALINTYTPEVPPRLPKTGQLNWPIPVLFASGVILIGLGCCLRSGRKKDDYA